LAAGLWLQAAVALATNLAAFALLRAGAAEPWVWAAVFASYAPFLAALARKRTVQRVVDNPAERLMWAVWVGHFLATAGVFASARIAHPGNYAAAFEAGYAACAALNGLSFFVMGSAFTGRLFPLGLGWVAVGVAMPLTPGWA